MEGVENFDTFSGWKTLPKLKRKFFWDFWSLLWVVPFFWILHINRWNHKFLVVIFINRDRERHHMANLNFYSLKSSLLFWSHGDVWSRSLRDSFIQNAIMSYYYRLIALSSYRTRWIKPNLLPVNAVIGGYVMYRLEGCVAERHRIVKKIWRTNGMMLMYQKILGTWILLFHVKPWHAFQIIGSSVEMFSPKNYLTRASVSKETS